ncbi:MAG TPA: AAA family ATPase [Pirellulaceae bacterium]|nr:AAA family ATPase [Pirellulaceae bacterium]
MRITDIKVGGFGVWNDVSVDALPGEVTLFYGRNEAGKTTLMQFVRAILYGFSPERKKLYLPPVFGGDAGGTLHVENHSGGFSVERLLEDDDHVLGRPVILAENNGSRQGQHLLNVLLSGIDESIFNNVFAVGIRELQELATLDDTQAAEQLYNLASGVDRVSLVEVMRTLDSRRVAIWGADEENELTSLVANRNRLQGDVDELRRQTHRWSELARDQRSLVDEVARFEERIQRLEYEGRTVEIAVQVRDKWQALERVTNELDAIGPIEDLPEGCLERVDLLNAEIAEQRAAMVPVKKRRHHFRQELASQPINRSLWQHSSRIEAMCEHGPWIKSLEEDLLRLSGEVEASEIALLNYDEEFIAQGGIDVTNMPKITPRVIQQLEPPATAYREAIKQRGISRKVRKKSQQDAESADDQLDFKLHGRDIEDFDSTLEQAVGTVKQLHRKIDIEDQLVRFHRQAEDLRQEHQEKLDDQLLRVRLLGGVGTMFVFGFVMLMTGAFGWRVMPMSAEVAWSIACLGCVCIGLSVAWKTVVERTTQEELDTCLRRREALSDDMELATAERDSIDRELPSSSGTLNTQLTIAEKELKELEALAPLHQERLKTRKRKHDAKRSSSGVDEQVREARSRWRRALRNVGLPESLTHRHVRQIGSLHDKKATVELLLVDQCARLEKVQKDREALLERMRQLNADIGLDVVSDEPQIQLSQLATALAGQREMVQQRQELQANEKQVRRELSDMLQRLRKSKRSREALFAQARVTDEEQLRERAGLLGRVTELDARHQSLAEQIRTIVGGHCPLEEVERELDSHEMEELQVRWDTLISRLQDTHTHLSQLYERRGEVNQEMKQLAENRGFAAAKLELTCVEAKIKQAIKQWRGLAVIACLLESIREAYEAERQPETLSEASVYLETLTDGKYTRIWTPLGKNELRIDDRQGKPMSLDVLSRGTREAVFLSLRLALVAAYGRRGVNLPMILDDVLVNLDIERARSAVQLLCQFAKEGRQLLFFTCHDHIQQMFVEAEVDVRILPAHGQPGLKIEPYGAESPDEEMEDTESLDPELVDDEEEMEPYEVEADDACEIEEDEESHEIEAEADDETDQLVEEEEEHEIAIHLDEVVEEVEQVDERNKIEEITPEIDLTSFFRKKEVVVNSEPVVVEDVTMDKQLVKVDEVFNDLSDTQPFENGPWWWETSRGLPGDTKEENAA